MKIPKKYIIGFSGHMGSGKNLAAQLLKNYFLENGYSENQVVIKCFGDFVKNTLCNLFQIPEEYFYTRAGKKYKTGIMYHNENLTVRRLLQIFGTNACRNTVSPDFWVIAMRKWINSPHNNQIKILLIPDCRFNNEAEICDLVFKINRKAGFNDWLKTFELTTECPIDLYDPIVDFQGFVTMLENYNTKINSPELSEFIESTKHGSESLKLHVKVKNIENCGSLDQLKNLLVENLTKINP